MSSSADLTSKISAKPFSSDTQAQKEELELEIGLFKDQLDQQLDGLKTQATVAGKKALIVGGIVASTYIVMNALLPKEKEDKPQKIKDIEVDEVIEIPTKKKKNKATQEVLKAAQGIAWTLAVGWARKQLMNYIAADRRANEKNKL
ncbi:hypothetical protein CLV98_101405 [Dyadobacter jejuensis]|uniref:Uncharacterized protein n=1 Tax=Dyadobacter jejuensis TaxID=1082580 RepID=A0A316ASJ2_9BACT|nr:hypothetical protein [Dyadobacter jejuensis]PWJ60224.1 hypothetical protein CLV98_101405 [Dyadobacter jejuensis]